MSSFTIVRKGPAGKIPLSVMSRTLPTSTSNSFEALSTKVDPECVLPKPPSMFDKIVWKASANDKVSKASKARKAHADKAHEYLHHGKTFSLDRYLSMVQSSSHKSGLGRFPASLLMRRPKLDGYHESKMSICDIGLKENVVSRDVPLSSETSIHAIDDATSTHDIDAIE